MFVVDARQTNQIIQAHTTQTAQTAINRAAAKNKIEKKILNDVKK